jgi:5-methyltetrahydrofolate--homocysteine methyltransferase
VSNKSRLKEFEEAIIDLKYHEIGEMVKNAIGLGYQPSEIISALRNGLKIIGDKYQSGEFFLSELFLAAETMHQAMNSLKPHINAREEQFSKGKIVIGSIQGDIHDFGKTIISSLLSANGIEVIDIGIDAPPMKFISEALKVDANIIGISALLSSTQPLSKKVIEILKEKGHRDKFKVILGGSGVDQKTAINNFGVDAAVNDGAEGVDIILSWLGKGGET